ncbi:acetoin reductase family protein [Cyathus striatus]|nr:acetoin reductase family protein [Cyathus striatus]
MSSSQGVAVITGSSQGIGKAIALRLADDGFDILVNDITSENKALQEVKDVIINKGRRCFSYIADVSVESEIIGMIKFVVEELGGIDVMVANAGIASIGSIVDAPLEGFDKHYAVNVRGVFLCYKYAALQMIKQGRGGRIIGASSVAGKQGNASPAYAASKFAVRGLTQSAGAELGKYGITVNAYAPGVIDTDMWKMFQDLLGDEAKVFEANPVGRLGTGDDIANLVSFLASSKSGFITGASFTFFPSLDIEYGLLYRSKCELYYG